MVLSALQKTIVVDLLEHHWSHVEEIASRIKRSPDAVSNALAELGKRKLVESDYYEDEDDPTQETECWAIHYSRASGEWIG